jgi:hypothetical protein
MLVQQHLDRIWVGVQFLAADNTEEGAPVAAVVEPVLLLPSGEARRAASDLLEDRHGHVGRLAPSVGEGGVEPLGGAPVGDARRADLALRSSIAYTGPV